MPQVADARYDFTDRTFRTGDGEPLTDGIARIWGVSLGRSGTTGIGSATLKRGIFLSSLAYAEGGARSRLLEQILRKPDQRVGSETRDIFYSRVDATAAYRVPSTDDD